MTETSQSSINDAFDVNLCYDEKEYGRKGEMPHEKNVETIAVRHDRDALSRPRRKLYYLTDAWIRTRYCDSCFWSGCPMGDDASSFDGPCQNESAIIILICL